MLCYAALLKLWIGSVLFCHLDGQAISSSTLGNYTSNVVVLATPATFTSSGIDSLEDEPTEYPSAKIARDGTLLGSRSKPFKSPYDNVRAFDDRSSVDEVVTAPHATVSGDIDSSHDMEYSLAVIRRKEKELDSLDESHVIENLVVHASPPTFTSSGIDSLEDEPTEYPSAKIKRDGTLLGSRSKPFESPDDNVRVFDDRSSVEEVVTAPHATVSGDIDSSHDERLEHSSAVMRRNEKELESLDEPHVIANRNVTEFQSLYRVRPEDKVLRITESPLRIKSLYIMLKNMRKHLFPELPSSPRHLFPKLSPSPRKNTLVPKRPVRKKSLYKTLMGKYSELKKRRCVESSAQTPSLDKDKNVNDLKIDLKVRNPERAERLAPRRPSMHPKRKLHKSKNDSLLDYAISTEKSPVVKEEKGMEEEVEYPEEYYSENKVQVPDVQTTTISVEELETTDLRFESKGTQTVPQKSKFKKRKRRVKYLGRVFPAYLDGVLL